MSSLADLVGDCPDRVDESNSKGISDFEWDNLIILDACRKDIYEQVIGKSSSRITRGSHSSDFVKENFSEGNYEDTLVITANPHYSEKIFRDETGKKPEDVFHAVFHTYRNRWNDGQKTVLPEDVKKDVETASKLFPEKRLIIHFMQPHIPFINSSEFFDGFEHLVNGGKGGSPGSKYFWKVARDGDFSKEEIFEPYSENLELVMKTVEELENVLSGRTVITSDHGNLVGEHGMYGHPRGKDYQPLREVPLEIKNL